MKKKILVILPDLPQKSYAKPIEQSLLFLSEDYQLDFIDPLDISNDVDNEVYFHHCREWMQKIIPQYDAFFGLSFGGVILQQCFSLFEQIKKPIVLFSSPSFADDALKRKLREVISLCKELRVDEALISLYQHVFYPNQPTQPFLYDDKEATAARVIFGLQHVLDTDSQAILQQTKVAYLHLMGEASQLVNVKNVVMAKTGSLLLVPNAGMRVLQSNRLFCERAILERLTI